MEIHSLKGKGLTILDLQLFPLKHELKMSRGAIDYMPQITIIQLKTVECGEQTCWQLILIPPGWLEAQMVGYTLFCNLHGHHDLHMSWLKWKSDWGLEICSNWILFCIMLEKSWNIQFRYMSSHKTSAASSNALFYYVWLCIWKC